MSLLKNNLWVSILLFLILIISLFVRFYKLDIVPNGFHIDEAIIADNANFILNTGKDTNNNFLPLQTEVFGDYNPTGYAYLAIAPIKILGLTIFAARSVGALLGALAAIGVFFLAYSIFERTRISLLASLFTALSPWGIALSRSTEETAASLVFIIFGFALLIWSVKKEKILYLLIAVFLLFISYFMYFTPRLFVPLIFLLFFAPLGYWYEKRKTVFLKIFISCFLFLAVASFILVFGASGGSNRFNQVSIFGFPETKLVMEEQIREDGMSTTPIILTRIFHNKILNYSLTYAQNYLEYFSGEFLFTKGGFPIWLNASRVGLVYIVELPFIIYGLYLLVKEKKKWGFLMLGWLLIAPIIASLTVDDIPNTRRALVMVPVLEILAAYGAINFLESLSKRVRAIGASILVILFILNSLYFFHQYFVHTTIHQNWYRSEGFEQMMSVVKKDYSDVDKIVVSKSSGGIYPLILFYMNYSPSVYLKEGHTKDKAYTGFGKFFFVDAACPSIDRDSKFPNVKNTIYIDDGNCRNYKTLKLAKHIFIYRKDGTKVFRMVYN